MGDERKSWEDGLDNLIRRAELANEEAQEEIRYLEKLERFIGVSRELRETFRTYVLSQSPPPLPVHDDEYEFPRVARAREVANGINREVFSRPQ